MIYPVKIYDVKQIALFFALLFFAVSGYAKIIATEEEFILMLDETSSRAYVKNSNGNIICREDTPFQPFDAEKITKIYIPEDIYKFERDNDEELVPYIIYNDKKIFLRNDIFRDCAGLKIVSEKAYEQLPDDCQFIVSQNDCERYVCSKYGCKWIYADFIIDMEIGEYYPIKF